MSNRLAGEASPYLLQHADNPVDWYPWGEEALEKARREDKPIFLSIGYAACHWCHVMAHESFEDPETAALINEHFVPIKVDREERPDLDAVYIHAVQAMVGSAGWPLSVFLTPEGIPFFGGTYFPSTPRYGMPAFRDVLLAVADAWENRRQELEEGGQEVVTVIQQRMAVASAPGGETCRPETLATAFHNLWQAFDPIYGGWGEAPKFPQPMVLEFLLRHHHATGDSRALQMVTQTLGRMARGGIYDQLGGGFHRYSVDGRWLVPHFEKMLYDNALLARVYLHVWQVTDEPFFRTIAEETLDYVAREMTHPDGGFFSTQDADSEGEEGKFYLWSLDEIRTVLGEAAGRFVRLYGVTADGNFEGRNILTFSGTPEEREALTEDRRKLFELRQRRVPPARDEKVLTSWNGLMLAAFAEAARVLGREDYREVAERNASFLLRELRSADGRLYRSWRDGKVRGNGHLEDYAHLIEGLLELYQTTFDPRWYEPAQELAETMVERFAAPVGFFDTSDDHEALIVRPRELQDNALPSGNGMAATVLLRLEGLAVKPRYGEMARRSLGAIQPLLARYPLGFGQWLIALDYALARPWEIGILGDLEAAGTRALLKACTSGYHPHQVVAAAAPSPPPAVPLLRDRGQVEGRPTAYICREGVCRPPTTDPTELREWLQEG